MPATAASSGWPGRRYAVTLILSAGSVGPVLVAPGNGARWLPEIEVRAGAGVSGMKGPPQQGAGARDLDRLQKAPLGDRSAQKVTERRTSQKRLIRVTWRKPKWHIGGPRGRAAKPICSVPRSLTGILVGLCVRRVCMPPGKGLFLLVFDDLPAVIGFRHKGLPTWWRRMHATSSIRQERRPAPSSHQTPRRLPDLGKRRFDARIGHVLGMIKHFGEPGGLFVPKPSPCLATLRRLGP